MRIFEFSAMIEVVASASVIAESFAKPLVSTLDEKVLNTGETASSMAVSHVCLRLSINPLAMTNQTVLSGSFSY